MSSRSVGTTPILRRAAPRLQGATSAIIATVRIGVALPNYGPLASPDVLARLASLAEARGADGIWVSDHLVAPVGSRSVYPYDRRPDPAGPLGLEGVLRGMVTLAFLAGQTRRALGVAPSLPCRNPVSGQNWRRRRFSGGRVVLAIGVGGCAGSRPRCAPPGRGRRTDEYLAVCRALWAAACTGRPTGTSRARRPRPVQRPIRDADRRQLGRDAARARGWRRVARDRPGARQAGGVVARRAACS